MASHRVKKEGVRGPKVPAAPESGLAQFVAPGKFEDVVSALADEFENQMRYDLQGKAGIVVAHNRAVLRSALMRGFSEGKAEASGACERMGGHFFPDMNGGEDDED